MGGATEPHSSLLLVHVRVGQPTEPAWEQRGVLLGCRRRPVRGVPGHPASQSPTGCARSDSLPEVAGEELWFRWVGHSWRRPSEAVAFVANRSSPLGFCVSGLFGNKKRWLARGPLQGAMLRAFGAEHVTFWDGFFLAASCNHTRFGAIPLLHSKKLRAQRLK